MEKNVDYSRLMADLALFSADERRVLEESGLPLEDLGRLAQARRRTQQRRASDAATDNERRTLIGARIPREQARKYKEAAKRRDISLYRFVCEALERELDFAVEQMYDTNAVADAEKGNLGAANGDLRPENGGTFAKY